MAEFLTTSGTSYNIEKIILEARKKLVLVSPFLQLSKTFFERLKDASKRGVQIKLIYGKDELKYNERNSLAQLENTELYFFENLHAKCYFNEKNMVITSMNMYEFSEKNNREMGVLIERKTDGDIFDKAVNETLSIMQSSEQIQFNDRETKKNGDRVRKSEEDKKANPKNTKQKKKSKWLNIQLSGIIEPDDGYCIRCKKSIPYNPERPYCSDCFKVWVQYENDDFEENYCHRCGKKEYATILKPQCYRCYDHWQHESGAMGW